MLDLESFSRLSRVSRETMERFYLYESLVLKWQSRINLVSESSLQDLWGRHMWDSAQLTQIVPPKSKVWVDLGSGAGFPGLVVALIGADDNFVHLIESDQRKCAFLREVVRQTQAAAEVHNIRIEALKGSTEVIPDHVDVITSRACAPLDRLLGYAFQFWGPDTVALLHKGRNTDSELTDAAEYWNMSYELIPSLSDPDGVILKVTELSKRGAIA